MIDCFIIDLLFVIITIGFHANERIINDAEELVLKYSNQEITLEDYNTEVRNLNYELQKSNISVNIVSFVIIAGYYFVFNYLNSGQTIGKKLCKIKVVEKGERPRLKAIILRGLIIYGILSTLYNIIFVYLFDAKEFSYGYTIVTYLESLFSIICLFMVLYRKDRRGLHDIMAGTEVIEEGGQNGKN